jgi:uncharacterized protein YprB with RNaseH-like and TPR domain
MITSCCFDLETSSLNANFGIVLCGVIKGSDRKKPYVFRGDDFSAWKEGRRSDDASLVGTIVTCLNQYDVLVAHNGARFDVAFLRTRMANWGLGAFPNKKLVDPVLIARNKLRMSSNSLASLASLIGAGEKTVVDGKMWLRASLDGDKEAMDYIVKHCVIDVQILEKVADAVKAYSSVFNSYGSGY